MHHAGKVERVPIGQPDVAMRFDFATALATISYFVPAAGDGALTRKSKIMPGGNGSGLC